MTDYDNMPVQEDAFYPPVKNLSRLMFHALDGENATIDKYAGQINCIDDPDIIEILKRIIDDEKLHVLIFQRIIAEHCIQCRTP